MKNLAFNPKLGKQFKKWAERFTGWWENSTVISPKYDNTCDICKKTNRVHYGVLPVTLTLFARRQERTGHSAQWHICEYCYKDGWRLIFPIAPRGTIGYVNIKTTEVIDC